MAPGPGAAGKPAAAALAASAARAALAIAEPTLVRPGVAPRALGEEPPATPPVRPVVPRGEAGRDPARMACGPLACRPWVPGPWHATRARRGKVRRYRVAHARCPVPGPRRPRSPVARPGEPGSAVRWLWHARQRRADHPAARQARSRRRRTRHALPGPGAAQPPARLRRLEYARVGIVAPLAVGPAALPRFTRASGDAPLIDG
jgi:hypothetical protein